MAVVVVPLVAGGGRSASLSQADHRQTTLFNHLNSNNNAKYINNPGNPYLGSWMFIFSSLHSICSWLLGLSGAVMVPGSPVNRNIYSADTGGQRSLYTPPSFHLETGPVHMLHAHAGLVCVGRLGLRAAPSSGTRRHLHTGSRKSAVGPPAERERAAAGDDPLHKSQLGRLSLAGRGCRRRLSRTRANLESGRGPLTTPNTRVHPPLNGTFANKIIRSLVFCFWGYFPNAIMTWYKQDFSLKD